ncbi:hypothetical protein AX774_g616 [Zancudomyces culisetae]|uniref:Uncharacterized protein n=1 Tax=Zancudomyces culisetae TaxID=1213189 RepID=A0A1R1PY01_ZANCU|nr:hypothetical protein AX774_g616 [Zancudomyces culisetae]|eukprot:OMH85808.1 hypothetical protein AX774_g616 [Zancudomyces culisetae]
MENKQNGNDSYTSLASQVLEKETQISILSGASEHQNVENESRIVAAHKFPEESSPLRYLTSTRGKNVITLSFILMVIMFLLLFFLLPRKPGVRINYMIDGKVWDTQGMSMQPRRARLVRGPGKTKVYIQEKAFEITISNYNFVDLHINNITAIVSVHDNENNIKLYKYCDAAIPNGFTIKKRSTTFKGYLNCELVTTFTDDEALYQFGA